MKVNVLLFELLLHLGINSMFKAIGFLYIAQVSLCSVAVEMLLEAGKGAFFSCLSKNHHPQIPEHRNSRWESDGDILNGMDGPKESLELI